MYLLLNFYSIYKRMFASNPRPLQLQKWMRRWRGSFAAIYAGIIFYTCGSGVVCNRGSVVSVNCM